MGPGAGWRTGTGCVSVCVDDGGDDVAGASGPASHVSRSSLLVDQTRVGQRSFCSWHDAGWRSLVVRDLTAWQQADDVVVPAISDQLVVLVVDGLRMFESRHGRYWRRAQFTAGRIAMTAPGHAGTVRWRTPSPARQRALQVYIPGPLMAQTAARLWDHDAGGRPMPDALSSADPVLEHMLRALGGAARCRADDLYAESAAHFLAVHLLSRHVGLGVPRLSLCEDRRVHRAVDFMHDNLAAQVSIADVAAAVNLSEYHFIRVFRDATGDPPYRYLTRLRVDRARSLLAGSRLSLSEVAARCGFRSVAQMRAALRRVTGESPAQVRHRPFPG